jgi:hypothetical protein
VHGVVIDSGWELGDALAMLANGLIIGVYNLSSTEWPLHRVCFTSEENRSHEMMS